MDVDLRLLRSFALVAREGNLTRAAEQLFIAQPALTKQIKQLERLLGLQLFHRSRTGMALTEAGTALLARVPELLAGWDLAHRETRTAAARAAKVFRVGFIGSAANEATSAILATFAELAPGWQVELRQTSWSEPTGGLAGGSVDAALLRLPFPGQDRYLSEVLLTEPRWVALASDHPLAGRPEIAFEELLDDPVIAAPGAAGVWRDHWLAIPERAGHPVRIGAVTDQPDEWLTAIASGYGIGLTPESSSRYYARPGVTFRRVSGLPPSQVAVVTPKPPDQLTELFLRACRAHRTDGRSELE